MFNMFKISHRGFSRFYSYHTKIITSIMEKNPILYGDEASPPVRFVLMTASILNIKMDYHEINLFKGEQKTKFYKKINPLQKVPALVVQDRVICDSHAICIYLCQQSDNNILYPNDAFTKARINEMLFFNSGTLFPVNSAIYTDYFAGKWPADQIKLAMLNSALDHLELQLTKICWLTGDKIRLCDIALMATVTSIYQIVQKTDKHKNIAKWLKKLETLPFYEINKCGLERLRQFIKNVPHNPDKSM